MKYLLLINFLIWANLSLAGTEAFFSPKFDSDDASLEEVIVDKLNIASESIDISIYTFSSNRIRETLLGKIEEGINVRIIINDGNKEKVEAFVLPLVEAGADVRYVTKINHHKFIIIDQSLLVNSSGNFSGSNRARSYDENLIACDNCNRHLAAYQNEFNALFRFSNYVYWENEVEPPTAAERRDYVHKNYSVALFTSFNFFPTFRRGKITFKTDGPNEDGAGKVDMVLVNAIDNAETSVTIATGHFRSKPLYDAVVRAFDRGVEVQIVLDGQEYISDGTQRKENEKIRVCMEEYDDEAYCYQRGIHYGRLLDKMDIDVRFKYYALRWHFPYAKQMHHKYMVVDKRTLYTGSYNWSYNAEFQTFENIAIFNTRRLIQKYLRNFNTIYNYGDGDEGYSSIMSLFRNATNQIPVVFDPISLTIDQIDKVKKLARRRCPRLYTNPIASRVCRF